MTDQSQASITFVWPITSQHYNDWPITNQHYTEQWMKRSISRLTWPSWPRWPRASPAPTWRRSAREPASSLSGRASTPTSGGKCFSVWVCQHLFLFGIVCVYLSCDRSEPRLNCPLLQWHYVYPQIRPQQTIVHHFWRCNVHCVLTSSSIFIKLFLNYECLQGAAMDVDDEDDPVPEITKRHFEEAMKFARRWR